MPRPTCIYPVLALIVCVASPSRADDVAAVLDAYQVACQSVCSYEIVLTVNTFPKARQSSDPPLVKVSRQVFSRGEYRSELLNDNGSDVPRGRVAAVFDGQKDTSVRIGPKSTSAVVSAAAVSTNSVGGISWSALFQDAFPGITYASIIRDRDSHRVPRTDALVEILSPPEAKSGRNYWSVGFRLVLDPSRGFMPVRIDHLLDRERHLRLWTRFENELAEVESGLWVPVRCRRTSHNVDSEGEQSFGYEEVVVDLSRSHFNQPIAASEFSLEIPVGAGVDDRVNKVSYVAGRENINDHLDELTRQGRATMERLSENRLQVDQSGRSSRIWWLIGVNALLVVAALILAARRFFPRKVN